MKWNENLFFQKKDFIFFNFNLLVARFHFNGNLFSGKASLFFVIFFTHFFLFIKFYDGHCWILLWDFFFDRCEKWWSKDDWKIDFLFLLRQEIIIFYLKKIFIHFWEFFWIIVKSIRCGLLDGPDAGKITYESGSFFIRSSLLLGNFTRFFVSNDNACWRSWGSLQIVHSHSSVPLTFVFQSVILYRLRSISMNSKYQVSNRILKK